MAAYLILVLVAAYVLWALCRIVRRRRRPAAGAADAPIMRRGSAGVPIGRRNSNKKELLRETGEFFLCREERIRYNTINFTVAE